MNMKSQLIVWVAGLTVGALVGARALWDHFHRLRRVENNVLQLQSQVEELQGEVSRQGVELEEQGIKLETQAYWLDD